MTGALPGEQRRVEPADQTAERAALVRRHWETKAVEGQVEPRDHRRPMTVQAGRAQERAVPMRAVRTQAVLTPVVPTPAALMQAVPIQAALPERTVRTQTRPTAGGGGEGGRARGKGPAGGRNGEGGP